jgi:hypothetical protein
MGIADAAFQVGGCDSYDFNGFRVDVESNSEEALQHLRRVYGRFREGKRDGACDRAGAACLHLSFDDRIATTGRLLVSGGAGAYTLVCRDLLSFDHAYYGGPGSMPTPLAFLQWYVLESLSRLASREHLLHAGSVAWGDHALLLPGESGRGKTTLTLALVGRGFRFLSDEVAWVRAEDRRVLPFPRRINADEGTRRLLGLPAWPEGARLAAGAGDKEWFLDIEDIVPGAQMGAATLRWVVFLAGFGPAPEIRPIPKAAALRRLIQFWLCPPERPARTLFEAAPLLDGVRCFELVAGGLGATAGAIEALLREESPPAAEARP